MSAILRHADPVAAAIAEENPDAVWGYRHVVEPLGPSEFVLLEDTPAMRAWRLSVARCRQRYPHPPNPRAATPSEIDHAASLLKAAGYMVLSPDEVVT